jgi:hypothetical protein
MNTILKVLISKELFPHQSIGNDLLMISIVNSSNMNGPVVKIYRNDPILKIEFLGSSDESKKRSGTLIW